MTMFGSQWLANAGSTYEIEQSIRFNDDDTPYLQRTPGSAGNDHTWTVSFWIKRGSDISDTNQQNGIVGAGDGADMGGDVIRTDSIGFYNDTLQIFTFGGSSPYADLRSTVLFRDPSSWYHFVIRYDDTQSTATNRVRAYVNGVQVTTFSPANYPDQNSGTSFNTALLQRVGANTVSTSRNIDGYLAEIVMIDGTSLGPGSFAETDSTTGQWVPIDVAGLTYGTNGFRLKGQDSSALGDDTSGNGNDFASSGLAANDQRQDTPTNNCVTANPLSVIKHSSYVIGGSAFSDGNLTVATTQSGSPTRYNYFIGTQSPTYNYYYEFKIDTVETSNWGGAILIPLSNSSVNTSAVAKAFSTSGVGVGFVVAANDIIGVTVDYDNDEAKFYLNNSLQGSASSLTAGEVYIPGAYQVADSGTWKYTFRFQASDWTYTPASGFVEINSTNLPAPATADPSAYFQTTLYEGDGSTQSIDQDGSSTFSPNLVWIKNRDATDAHALFDTVRGATKVLSSNVTTAEATNDDTLTAFESDGFAIGDDVIVNTNAESYVAWQWNEGTTPGLDIVSYAGTGSARTVAHNLGVVPEMIIIKNRDQDDDWAVYHVSLGNTHRLLLNSDLGPVDDSSFWNDTTPTSSVFTVGGNHAVNANTENYIAYVFAPVEGFSSFGTYTGNHNANGPMVNLGFAPACVIFKSSTQDRWFMKDIKRDPYNVTTKSLHPDENLAEISGTSAAADFNSNGFKIRTNESPVNQAKSYYYAAFAHAPFKTANAR
jgi:hypothetical protein